MGDTMRALRYITDLEGYLADKPGKHVIVTGTYDPPHAKHVAPILMSYEQLQAEGITNPFIIIAHSKNKKKIPTATLRERQEWILDTFDFFAAEIAHRVMLCIDPDITEPHGKYIYGLPGTQQDRLIRIAGNDKETEIRPGRIETRFINREAEMMSSTTIRALMKLTRSHPTLREYLAPKVYTEVVSKRYYMDSAKLGR